MLTDDQLVEQGIFTQDEINDSYLEEQNQLVSEGKPIGETPMGGDLVMPSQNGLITPRLNHGFSPYLTIGKEGRFDFNVEPRNDPLFPGQRHLFRGYDGTESWKQLETEYQGGRWEDQPHAENQYDRMKDQGAGTRGTMIDSMFPQSLAEVIKNNIELDTSFEELKLQISKLDTNMQSTIFDKIGTEEAPTDPYTEESLRNLENTLLVYGKEPDQIAKIATEYGITGEELQKMQDNPMGWINAVGLGQMSQSGYLGFLLDRLESGDPKAAKTVAEIYIQLANFENMSFKAQTAFSISSILNPSSFIAMGFGCRTGATGGGKVGGYIGQAVGQVASILPGPVPKAIGKTGKPLGTAIGAGVGCMGGAMAVDTTIRSAYMYALEQKLAGNEVEFLQLFKHASKEGLIAGKHGAVAGIAGMTASAALYARGVNKPWAHKVARTPAEAFAFTSMSAGGLPEERDFALALATFSGLHISTATGGYVSGKVKGAVLGRYRRRDKWIEKNLKEAYVKWNLDPRDLIQISAENPEMFLELKATLSQERFVPPKYYMVQFAEMMHRLQTAVIRYVDLDTGKRIPDTLDSIAGAKEPLRLEAHIKTYEKGSASLTIVGTKNGDQVSSIKLSMQKDGNWHAEEVTGTEIAGTLKAMIEFATSRGRKVVSEDITIQEVADSARSEMSIEDAKRASVAETKEEIKSIADQLTVESGQSVSEEYVEKSIGMLKDLAGEEVFETARKFAVGKEGGLAEASFDSFIKTGWHSPYYIALQQKMETPVDPIEMLVLPKRMIEQTEVLATTVIKGEGDGILIFTGDNAAHRKAGTAVRAHIKYTNPLELRAQKDFASATEDGTNPIKIAKYLANERLNILTPEEASEISFSHSPSRALADLMVEKGYDSATFESSADKEDALMMFDKDNVKKLGQAEITEGNFKFEALGVSGSYNLSLTNSPQSVMIMGLPEVIELSRQLTGKLPSVKPDLGDGVRGKYTYSRDSHMIELAAWIAANPNQAAQVVGHEIGHLDHMQVAGLKGTVLNAIVGLKGAIEGDFISTQMGGKTFTKEELNALKEKARKEIEEVANDKDLQKELGITPQQIKDIFTGVAGRAEADPAIYEFIASLSRQGKREVLRILARKQIPPEIQEIINAGKEAGEDASVLEQKINDKYAELIVASAKDKGLISTSKVIEELTNVSKQWRPYDEELATPEYRAYRGEHTELYADFMSAFFTNPRWLELEAPQAFELLMGRINSHPELLKSHQEIARDMFDGTFGDKLSAKIMKDMKDGDEAFFRAMEKRAKDLEPSKVDEYLSQLWDQHHKILSDLRKYKNKEVRVQVRESIERLLHKEGANEGYTNNMIRRVLQPIDDLAIDFHRFSTYMLYRRLATEQKRTGKPERFGTRGVTADHARREMERMEEIEPRLAEIADAFWEIRREWVMDELKESGLSTPKLMKLLLNNKEYVTININEYIENNFGLSSADTGGKIHERVGSVKEGQNVVTATIFNDVAMMRASHVNKAKLDIYKFYKEASVDSPEIFRFEPANTKFDGVKQVVLEPKDPTLGLMTLKVDGVTKSVYVDKYVAKSLKSEPGRLVAAGEILAAANKPFRLLFTELNYGFWLYNAIRDYHRSVRNLPATGIDKVIPSFMYIRYAPHAVKGLKEAWKYNRRGEASKIIDRMLKERSLISSVNDPFGGSGREALDTEAILIKKYHQSSTSHSFESANTLKRSWESYKELGLIIERGSKIAAQDYLEKYYPEMPQAERAHTIRALASSPAFLRMGSDNLLFNNLLLYANPIKEGWRGDYEVLTTRPIETMYKLTWNTFVPKYAMYMTLQGLYGEENKKIMEGVPEDRMKNHMIVPLGMTADGKAVVLEFPQDETANLFGNLFFTAINEGSEFTPSSTLKAVTGATPTITPMVDAAVAGTKFLLGENYVNDFTGKNVISDDEMKAGGSAYATPALKHMSNQLGFGMVYRFKADTTTAAAGELEKILQTPGLQNSLGKFIKIYDRGYAEKREKAGEEEEKAKAQNSIIVKDALEKRAKDSGYVLTPEEMDALEYFTSSISRRAGNIFMRTHPNPYIRQWYHSRNASEKLYVYDRSVASGGRQAKEFHDFLSKQKAR